jgi:hypothetical protein
MNSEFVRLFREPAFVEFLDTQYVESAVGTPEQFVAFLKKDREEAGQLVKRFNIPKQSGALCYRRAAIIERWQYNLPGFEATLGFMMRAVPSVIPRPAGSSSLSSRARCDAGKQVFSTTQPASRRARNIEAALHADVSVADVAWF